MHPRPDGFTLLELLIAMAVLAILISLATPGMSGYFANQRLAGAAQQLYSQLQLARSEAIARGVPVTLTVVTDGSSNWAYGMSHVNNPCNPAVTSATATNACRMVVSDGDAALDPGTGAVDPDDLVLVRTGSEDFPGVVLAGAGSASVSFDPVRGMASGRQFTLNGSNGNQLRVSVSLLGRVALCSPDGRLSGYQDC